MNPFPGQANVIRVQYVKDLPDDISPDDDVEERGLKFGTAWQFGKNRYRKVSHWMGYDALAKDKEYFQVVKADPSLARYGIVYRIALDYIEEEANGRDGSLIVNETNYPDGKILHGPGVVPDLDPVKAMLMQPGMKVVNAKGQHSCQSSKNLGYKCDVENRIYNDCDTAVRKLQQTNCCNKDGINTDGVSIGYTHKSCF
jgi:hypothetical protein